MERTASTPMTANHSPDEIQSDSSLDPASSSQITEGEKPLTVIHENSEEAISNIITAVDSHSDGCDAPAAQNQIVKPAAEVRLAVIVFIYCFFLSLDFTLSLVLFQNIEFVGLLTICSRISHLTLRIFMTQQTSN